MKNDSWMFPVETQMDSWFDSNNDGELSGLETMQRDAMLYESYKQTSSAFDSSNNNTSTHYKDYKLTTDKPSKSTNDTKPIVGDWAVTIVSFLVVAILFGSLVFTAKTKNPIVLFLGLAISIGLLWITRILTFD